MRKFIMLFLILSFMIIPTRSASAGVEIMDQTQRLHDYGFWFDSDNIRRQEFIPTLSNFTTLHIYVIKTGSPGNVIVEIRELGGTVLGHQEILEANVPSNDWLIVSFTQFSITPGTRYRIYVYSSQDSLSSANRYAWIWSYDSTYCPRCETDLSAHPDYDYSFRTFGVGIDYASDGDFDADEQRVAAKIALELGLNPSEFDLS